MSKSVFVLSILTALALGCGSPSTTSRGALTADIEPERVRLYDEVVKRGLSAYQRELEEAADGAYPSRQAALAMARTLGCESRIAKHLRAALAAEGLTMDDLFRFNAHHPGFADSLRPHFRELAASWDELVEDIATAPVDAPEGEAMLTASARSVGPEG